MCEPICTRILPLMTMSISCPWWVESLIATFCSASLYGMVTKKGSAVLPLKSGARFKYLKPWRRVMGRPSPRRVTVYVERRGLVPLMRSVGSIPKRSAHLKINVKLKSCSPLSKPRYSSSVTPVRCAISSSERPMISRMVRMRSATSASCAFRSVFSVTGVCASFANFFIPFVLVWLYR